MKSKLKHKLKHKLTIAYVRYIYNVFISIADLSYFLRNIISNKNTKLIFLFYSTIDLDFISIGVVIYFGFSSQMD